eukprot:TRINITY_DN15678_c0_g1_i1.p1 TRINITY_DN15678_c0_g1~~TRINITY_DN15678_c0_g1_i1.p1  ORF type:complete len:116 (+),score=45.58 TRINITY_DN15678_c0_g1_i1:194-541(+)
MSSVKEVAKKLSIKVKAVQRIQKDLIYYEKEYNQQAAKVQKMKDDGKDEYDIKKQEEVLEETNAMMPEARTRLEKAHADLEQAVEELKDDTDIHETEEWASAQKVIEEVGKVVKA